MVCQFERLLFPPSTEKVDVGSYMVAVYRPCEKLPDSLGNGMQRVTAVGYGLPTASRIRYDMQGQWCKNAKHGVQFKVENYSEVGHAQPRRNHSIFVVRTDKRHRTENRGKDICGFRQ